MNHKVVKIFGWVMVVVGVLAVIGSLTTDQVSGEGVLGGLLFVLQGAIIIWYANHAIKENHQTELEVALQAELAKRGI